LLGSEFMTRASSGLVADSRCRHRTRTHLTPPDFLAGDRHG
jgi:hypothetical protein